LATAASSAIPPSRLTLFLGLPIVFSPNKTSIHSAKPRDRQTDRTSVALVSLHLVHSMKPKSNEQKYENSPTISVGGYVSSLTQYKKFQSQMADLMSCGIQGCKRAVLVQCVLVYSYNVCWSAVTKVTWPELCSSIFCIPLYLLPPTETFLFSVSFSD